MCAATPAAFVLSFASSACKLATWSSSSTISRRCCRRIIPCALSNSEAIEAREAKSITTGSCRALVLIRAASAATGVAAAAASRANRAASRCARHKSPTACCRPKRSTMTASPLCCVPFDFLPPFFNARQPWSRTRMTAKTAACSSSLGITCRPGRPRSSPPPPRSPFPPDRTGKTGTPSQTSPPG